MLLVRPATRGAVTATTTPPTSMSSPALAAVMERSAVISFSRPAGMRTPVPMMKFPASSVHSRRLSEVWTLSFIVA